MNDWGLSVLSQYPIAVRSTRKVRGALLCDTDTGLYLLQRYSGRPQRLETEYRLLDYLSQKGGCMTDSLVRSSQEELLVRNEEDTGYVLKRWYPWTECNASSSTDVCQAVSVLARLHILMRNFTGLSAEDSEGLVSSREQLSLEALYDKHNRELRRVRAYLSRKKQKSPLEQLIGSSFSCMYEQAVWVSRELSASPCRLLEEQARARGYLTHGAYHQHNVLIGAGQTAVVNFEQFAVGCQLTDLYQFLRKIMEKHNWNMELGRRLVGEYTRILPLDSGELLVLGLMIKYPEKYWKQVNFYFNKNKSWISEKNIEKLKKAVEQYHVRTAFANAVCGCHRA